MKKLVVLLGVATMSAALFFTGCTEDEDPIPVGDPTIELVIEQGYVYSDVVMAANTEFKTKVNCIQNAATTELLQTLEVSRAFTATKADSDTTYSIPLDGETQIEVELSLFSFPGVGEEIFNFTVIDAVGNTNTISYTITTTNSVTKYTDVTLGSWDDALAGSFFASVDGEIFFKAQGEANLDKIDWCFFQGASNGTTIGSVIDTDVQTVYGIDWAGRDTRFQAAAIDATEFDAIGDTYTWPEFEGDGGTKINQLNVDDIVFFKTADGNRGYIKVNEVTNRGFIMKMDVIVE